MTHPIITDQDIEKGLKEAQAMVKVMRILKGVAPSKRFAVLESARILLEAEGTERPSP